MGEHPPAVEDDDNEEIDEGAPCGIGLELGSPWLVLVSDTLREASGAEPEEGDQNRHPSEERGDGCELKIILATATWQTNGIRMLTVWNQVKTLLEPFDTVYTRIWLVFYYLLSRRCSLTMYVKRPTDAVHKTQQIGTPFFVHIRKNFGA